MHTINARNVNEAYVLGARLLHYYGYIQKTRNGSAYVANEPVVTTYRRPMERVLFGEDRDANPYFHLFESLWILAGRKDVRWLAQFNSQIAKYSDDGEYFYGAYGFRMRRDTGGDMLAEAVTMLQKDRYSRRVYVPIYFPKDVGANSNDIPCNVGIKLEVDPANRLNMLVFNRSNDMIWGTFGANAVHFSVIQEYVAGCVQAEVGWYEQVSGNFHAYTDVWEKHELDNVVQHGSFRVDPYENGLVRPYPLFTGDVTQAQWDRDLREFTNEAQGINPTEDYQTPYFQYVVTPLFDSWEFYKQGNKGLAIIAAEECRAEDWRKACVEWLERRTWKEV
jgi:hypothetical protein